MKRLASWELAMFALLLFVPGRSGYADTAPNPMTVTSGGVQQSGSRVNWDVSVGPAPSGKLDFVMQTAGGNLRSEVKVRPVSLWVLLDGSNLCSSLNMDKRVNSLLDNLKREMHPDSLVSIGSYTGATAELIVANRRVGDLEDARVACENRQFSGSYEKLISLMLNQRADDRVPTYAWVYTSGSIQLTEATLKRIRARNLQLRLLLYNAFLQADLRGLVDEQGRFVGRDRMTLGVMPPVGIWPERWYQLSFDAPYAMQGKKNAITISVQANGKEISQSQATLSLAQGGGAHFWKNYGRYLVGLMLLAVIAYAVIRLRRYYRPRQCRSCARVVRFNDETCRFCLRPQDGYLVGRFNRYDRRKAGKEDLVVIHNEAFEIGSHRRSQIRMPRIKGRRALPALKIVKERISENEIAHRAIPANEQLTVTVNGTRLTKPRYLASGDRIRLEDYQTEMTFMQGEG